MIKMNGHSTVWKRFINPAKKMKRTTVEQRRMIQRKLMTRRSQWSRSSPRKTTGKRRRKGEMISIWRTLPKRKVMNPTSW